MVKKKFDGHTNINDVLQKIKAPILEQFDVPGSGEVKISQKKN